MTVMVAGSWELGYSAPLTELDHWQHLLREFSVDHWFMSPISGVKGPSFLTEVADLEQLLRITEIPVVHLDERGETPLREFDHPDDVLYVLGKQSFSPYRAYGGDSVRIETPSDSGMLWPHQALSIVLYDRVAKLWL